MAARCQSELTALQERAFYLLAGGTAVKEAAEALGVSPRTIRRWRQRKKAKAPGQVTETTVAPKAKGIEEMLRAEGPAVARVLLDLAKDGDVRAAALVVKLLGHSSRSAEESDDGDSESALLEIECELSSLPPVIASEIVGLLAQVECEAAGESGGYGASQGCGARQSVRLPWQEENRPPDQGGDPL